MPDTTSATRSSLKRAGISSLGILCWPAVRAFQLARAIKRSSASFSEYPHRTPGGEGLAAYAPSVGLAVGFREIFPGRDARIHPLWPEDRKAGSHPGRFTSFIPSPSKSSDCSYMPTRSAAGTATPYRYAQLRDGAGTRMKAMTRQSGDFSHPRELAARDPLRFQQAARLLHHPVLLGIGEPLSEIAYACGSRDQPRFAFECRRRFGHLRRACAEGDPGETVRACTSVSASWTRAV